MKWVRSNIRRVSRLALFAMAVQLALSFGHFHAIAAQSTPSIESTQQSSAPGHDSDRHPDEVCAICAVVALANTTIAAAPPVLAPPPTIERAHLTARVPVIQPRPARAAFQSRAPPVS